MDVSSKNITELQKDELDKVKTKKLHLKKEKFLMK